MARRPTRTKKAVTNARSTTNDEWDFKEWSSRNGESCAADGLASALEKVLAKHKSLGVFDEAVTAAMKITQAVAIALRANKLKELTGSPKTKRSLVRLAENILRRETIPATQFDAATWLERELRRIAELTPPPTAETPLETRCLFIVRTTERSFPKLALTHFVYETDTGEQIEDASYCPDDFERQRDRALKLAKKIRQLARDEGPEDPQKYIAKLAADDPERLVRMAVTLCGMPSNMAKGLFDARRHKIKREASKAPSK